MNSLTDQINKWIREQLDSECNVEQINQLPGSTSAHLYDLTVSLDGKSENLVLRLFTLKEWLAKEPDLALHEARALQFARQLPVPTPQLIAFDQEGSYCGTPAVLMTKLSGEVNLKPDNRNNWIEEQAKSLSQVHQLEAVRFPWNHFSYTDLNSAKVPRWTSFPELWEEALQIVKGEKPKVRMCFIHRDYHPANLLWENGRISGIVDWVNACRGPAGADVGHCRVNLAMLYGVEEADRFLRCYRDYAGARFQYELYYDLLSLCDCILPGPPTVYSGWEAFGIQHLTDEMMRQRTDQYLFRLMKG